MTVGNKTGTRTAPATGASHASDERAIAQVDAGAAEDASAFALARGNPQAAGAGTDNETKGMMMTYLTPDQVHQLNEKHGWFKFADAQSDVSKAFAQDAIEMYERVRAAAPDLLAALQACVLVMASDLPPSAAETELAQARAAINKATGAA